MAGLASLGSLVGLPFAIAGLNTWLHEGNARGIPLLLLGLAIIVGSLLALRWVGRTWQTAVATDAREARDAGLPAVPFGARPREGGVVLRPRAAIRVVPGVLVPMALMVSWGMAEDGLPIPATIVGVGSVGLVVLWVWLRGYELCLDHTGVWRRRRPRWRLAWSDLRSVEHKQMSNAYYPSKPDDLILHGRITTPSGRVRDTVRVRCNLLAILPEDFAALADQYSRAAAPSADSPSQTWS